MSIDWDKFRINLDEVRTQHRAGNIGEISEATFFTWELLLDIHDQLDRIEANLGA